MTIPTIVTVAQVQAHLRLPITEPQSEYDDDLVQKIAAATQLVCEHIADRQPPDLDWIAEIENWSLDEGSPSTIPPPIVVLAVMETVADFYRFRGDDAGDDRARARGHSLPLPVENLLYRYHSPSLA